MIVGEEEGMSSRTDARRDILEDAHEGREGYRPPMRVKRVGPRKWMSMSEYGYDYIESIRNWDVSRGQLIGFLVVISAFAVLLLWLFSLGPHFP